MAIRRLLWSLFLMMLISPVFASDPVEIPMTVAATGKILIDIKINDQPVTCIVDTGSPYFLLLDEVLADKMKLQKFHVRARLRFFAEDAGGNTYRAAVEHVAIGPFEFSQVEALTIDNIYRATGTGYEGLPNYWAQGIVGMGFLKQFHVRIDYPHNRFVLYPPEHLSPPEMATGLRPIAGVRVAADAIVPFLLDTGSSFSVVSEKVMPTLGMSYLSMTNADRLYKGLAKAEKLSIGSAEVRDSTFEIADEFEAFSGDQSFHGIVGYDILKQLVIDLNVPENQLSLEKP